MLEEKARDEDDDDDGGDDEGPDHIFRSRSRTCWAPLTIIGPPDAALHSTERVEGCGEVDHRGIGRLIISRSGDRRKGT